MSDNLTRRDLVKDLAFGGGALVTLALVGCGAGEPSNSHLSDDDFVIMYDTNAMALYFDGGLGPETGVITVDAVVKAEAVTMKFWHGHGGVLHQFSITPEKFREMRLMKKVMLETNVVEGHSHKLFVDFSDVRWRVRGAKPVKVPKIP